MIHSISAFLLLSATLGRHCFCDGASFPHSYFEKQRVQVIDTLQRRGNLDVDSSQDLAYCHLAGYLAFSRAADTECNVKQATKIYRELAAVYMAIQHFNNGNGVVVPEVSGIDQRCPIRLTAELIDSKYTPAIPVQSLTRIMGNRDTSTAQAPIPCGVVGARTSSATYVAYSCVTCKRNMVSLILLVYSLFFWNAEDLEPWYRESILCHTCPTPLLVQNSMMLFVIHSFRV